jgi:hypothetical protein
MLLLQLVALYEEISISLSYGRNQLLEIEMETGLKL